MSVVLNINAIKDCSAKNIKVLDTTGIYDSNLNQFGWGVPNERIQEVDYAHLFVTTPDGITIDLNVISVLPNIVNNPFIINEVSLGTALIDGLYSLKLHVEGLQAGQTVRFVKEATVKVNVQCALECCIANQLIGIEPSDCHCSDKKEHVIDVLLNATYLSAANKAAECNDDDSVNRLNEAVKKFCDGKDCGCGCQ
ncbi:MAG: hypothetical protein M3N30_00700 [Bacteroidota bacterium]|nr:hypothetical protein [Bacteroidota bacterium]